MLREMVKPNIQASPLTVRAVTEADFEAVGVVLDAAYHGSGLISGLRANFALQPDGWFCADRKDEIVGLVGAIDYGRFASIGMVGVHPNAQRQGIALKLMQHLLGWLDARRCPVTILDATDAGAPLYEKLGFLDNGRALRLKRAGHVPGQFLASSVDNLEVMDVPALLDYDMPIFGADRSRVFEMLRYKYPDRAFIIRDPAGQIGGYLFAQARLIGPWVAETPEIAEHLLQAALSLAYEGDPGVIIPSLNEYGYTLLTRYGFGPDRDLRHMWRGSTLDPRDRLRTYGQASFMLA